jgi:hypothetical protein
VTLTPNGYRCLLGMKAPYIYLAYAFIVWYWISQKCEQGWWSNNTCNFPSIQRIIFRKYSLLRNICKKCYWHSCGNILKSQQKRNFFEWNTFSPPFFKSIYKNCGDISISFWWKWMNELYITSVFSVIVLNAQNNDNFISALIENDECNVWKCLFSYSRKSSIFSEKHGVAFAINWVIVNLHHKQRYIFTFSLLLNSFSLFSFKIVPKCPLW